MRHPIYAIETILDTSYSPTGPTAPIWYERLQVLRYSFAQAVNATKKVNGNITKLNFLIEQIRQLKAEYSRAISRRSIKYLSRRIGGELYRVEFSGRTSSLEEIRERVRRIRKQRRYNEDKILNRKPLALFHDFQKRKLRQPKSGPVDQNKYVGIEIECITKRDADFSPLYPFLKYVNISGDGSIENGAGEEGTELKVCLKQDEVRDILPKIVDALVTIGARVNKSCGLHVHLDQRNNPEVALAFQKLVRSLGLLFTVVPRSRRSNRYCRKNRYADFVASQNGDRYYAINADAFNRYRTLEIRLFGGTLDANKIINWIETLHAIAYGEIVLRCPKNFDTALKYWNLSPENIAWLKARQEQFAALNALAPQNEADAENPVTVDNETELQEAA